MFIAISSEFIFICSMTSSVWNTECSLLEEA